MKPKGPLLIVIAVLLVAATLIGLDTFKTRVSVTAQDGSDAVIRLDPDDITDWSQVNGGSGLDGTRKYGVSTQAPAPLPEGNANEANLSGTKVR